MTGYIYDLIQEVISNNDPKKEVRT